MALFNQFSDYFGQTEINKIETTYRFGEPLVSLSSQFIQRNEAQIKRTSILLTHKLKQNYSFAIMKDEIIAMLSDNWSRQFH